MSYDNNNNNNNNNAGGGGFGNNAGGGVGGFSNSGDRFAPHRGGGSHSNNNTGSGRGGFGNSGDPIVPQFSNDNQRHLWDVMADIEFLDETTSAVEGGFFIPRAPCPSPSVGIRSRTNPGFLLGREESLGLTKELSDPRAFAVTLRFRNFNDVTNPTSR